MKLISYFIIWTVISFCTKNSLNHEKKEELGLLIGRTNRLTISGTAVKGVIRNGLVQVFPLASDGTCDRTRLLASDSTDEDGDYSIKYSRTNSIVCVVVSPSSTGKTTVFDEKSGRNLAVGNSSKFELITVIPESKINSNPTKSRPISPFSKFLSARFAALVKADKTTDQSALYKKASKEIVIRFGLSSGLSGVKAGISDSSYPELEDLDLDVKNPSNPITAKYLSVLSGFSYLANKYKKGSSVEITDIDSVLTGFSKDFEDGLFDGLNSQGGAVTIGEGTTPLTLPSAPLTGTLLPAIQSYFSEGGTFSIGSSQSPSNLTITSSSLTAQTLFVDNTPISSSAVAVPNAYYQWGFNGNLNSSTANVLTGSFVQTGAGPIPGYSATVKEGSSSAGFTAASTAYNNGGYISLGALNLGSAFSIALWINTTQPHASYTQKLQVLVSNRLGTAGTDDGFTMSVNQFNSELRNISLVMGDGSASYSIDSASNLLQYGVWMHIVAAIDKTAQTAKLYVNGTLIGSSSTPAVFSTNTLLRVGEMANFFHFTGSIDDMRIFNSVLSAAEVQALYAQ